MTRQEKQQWVRDLTAMDDAVIRAMQTETDPERMREHRALRAALMQELDHIYGVQK